MNKIKLLGKNYNLSLVIFFTLTLLLAACKTSNGIENDDYVVTDYATIVPTAPPDVLTYVIDEIPVAYASIPELSNESDIIIIGKIIFVGEIVNMARDIDPSKPDPNYFGIGQIYEVEIESYLKGNGDKTIEFMQYQGFIITESINLSLDEIEKTKSETEYIRLSINQRLLMFLKKSPYKYEEYTKGSLFISVGHPSLFDITDPECIKPLDTLIEIHKYFPPQPFTTFADQIDEPFDSSTQPDTFPYPPPEMINRCPEKSSEPYP